MGAASGAGGWVPELKTTMGKDDEDAARGSSEGSQLQGTLSAPIAAGSLDTALRAARGYQMLHPGDADAKRVVEALELMMSQVWMGGAEGGGDPRWAEASVCLEAADLAGARTRYEGILADGEDERASRLVSRIATVQAVLDGLGLPPDPASLEPPEEVAFDDSTRVAGDGELPLGAFQYDDQTVDVDPVIPADAFPDEPTRQLELGDYELIEERGPEPPKESTRVAQPGELPLDEVRRQVEGERSDAELDLLLDEMEVETGDADEPPDRPSLVLDIDAEEDDESSPTVRGEAPQPSEGSRRSFPRPREADLQDPSRAPSRTFRRPSESALEAPAAVEASGSRAAEPRAPESRDREVSEPARPAMGALRFDSSEPPPALELPGIDELGEDPIHAPLDTGEVSLPSEAQWDIREPGSESSDAGHAPIGAADSSWSGVRVYENQQATFEPGAEGMDVDSWEEPTQVGSPSVEEEAEACVARGELGEALRIYQDLAAQSPDEQRLWDRVAEIARMLQERSGG